MKWKKAHYGLERRGWTIEIVTCDISVNLVFLAGARFDPPPPLSGGSRYVKIRSIEELEPHGSVTGSNRPRITTGGAEPHPAPADPMRENPGFSLPYGAILQQDCMPMSLRTPHFALILALGAPALASAQAAPRPATDELERLSPVELRALQGQLDQQIAATREENEAAQRRIDELEKQNAELDARKAELDARLAEIQERLKQLEDDRGE